MTTASRGYGYAHKRLRAQWAPKVARGEVVCWRCSTLIAPSDAWDLGHDDHDRDRYKGPEHATCNRATNDPARRYEHPDTTADGTPTPRSRRWP